MLRATVFSILVLLIAACASTPTEIESTWKDPTYGGDPFDRIVVMAEFQTQAESRRFETAAVSVLRSRGVDAVAGHNVLEDKRYSADEMDRLLGSTEADGVLMFKLIAIDEDLRYRRPTPYLTGVPRSTIWGDPYYWYYYPHSTFYPYWLSARTVTRAPGYWQEVRRFVIESSLYDSETDRLVWSAKSGTHDDNELAVIADSVTVAVAERLAEARLLQTGARMAGAVSSSGY